MKNLFDIGIYASFMAIGQLLNALLVPLLFVIITNDVIANIAIFEASFAILAGIIGLGGDRVIQRYFSDTFERRRLVFQNLILINFILAMLVFCIISISDFFSDFGLLFCLLFVICVFCHVIFSHFLVVMQVGGSAGKYSVLNLLKTATFSVSMYFFYAVMHFDVWGYLISYYLSLTLPLVFAFLFFRPKEVNEFFNLSSFTLAPCSQLVRFGAPIAATLVTANVYQFSSRFVLDLRLDSESVATFFLYSKLSLFFLFLVQSVNLAVVPKIYSRLSSDINDHIVYSYAKLFSLFIFSVVLFIISTLALVDVFIDIVGFDILIFSLILTVHFVSSIVSSLHDIILAIIHRTQLLFFVYLFAALLNVALQFIFVHFWGLIGVAFAMSISSLVFYCVYSYLVSPLVSLRDVVRVLMMFVFLSFSVVFIVFLANNVFLVLLFFAFSLLIFVVVLRRYLGALKLL